MSDDALFLSQLPLFQGIAPQQITAMLACLGSYRQEYRKQEFVFLRGAVVQDIALLLHGRVQVLREDIDGNRNLVNEIGPGQMFAESFVAAGVTAAPVSALATEDSAVLFLRLRKIITTCDSACAFHHRMVENMLQILARKNLQLNEKIEHLSQRSTREKLLSYLRSQALQEKNRRFTVPFNRQELADYLSVERSAMCAALSRMQDEGLLRYHKNDFELLQIKE